MVKKKDPPGKATVLGNGSAAPSSTPPAPAPNGGRGSPALSPPPPAPVRSTSAGRKGPHPPFPAVDLYAEKRATTGSGGSIADPSIHQKVARFESEVALKYVADANWDELESYVEKFLKDVQGEDFHPHPGLMLSLYEARAYHLIQQTKNDQELEYVLAKVEAIDTKDDLYAPWDYADRVEKLKTYAETWVPPPKTDVPALLVALPQYIALYYPESLQMKRMYTLYDFVKSFRDKEGKMRHQCLACQWTNTSHGKIGQMVEHVFHLDQRIKHCDKVTRWMKKYMATFANIESGDSADTSNIESGDSADSSNIESCDSANNVVDDTSGKEGTSSLKDCQSATLSVKEGNQDDSLSVSIGGAARTLFELQHVNGVLSFDLKEDNTKPAISAKMILTEIGVVTNGLTASVLSKKHLDQEDFAKVMSLTESVSVLVPLQKHLPEVQKKTILKIGELVFGLFNHFLFEA